MEVRGSVALVTGAAAGTGREIARRLGADGALVVVADVDPRAGQETARAIEEQGGIARFVPTDVTSGDDLRRMVAFAERELGRPQILVNNAGGGGHVEPHYPDASPEYAAAKAGLIRFTSSLAGLPERMNVRVNCVVPDWIATDRAREELARMTPALRAATPESLPPEEVADAVLGFVRDENLAGRVMVMWPGEPARLLDPDLRA